MSAALLIATGRYDDAKFQSLSAPVQDVEAFSTVLRHPDIGAHRSRDTTTLIDPTLQQLRTTIATLCANRNPDELLLIYLSGHGIVNDQGQLFFPCRNTDSLHLEQTAYSVSELQSYLEASRSQRQVIMLDCCFSGTFAKNMIAPADIDAIAQQLVSNRRALLTSPWSIEYSPKYKSGSPSRYTQYLLNGLETGMADEKTLDGEITVAELHDYIRTRLEEDLPSLYPKLYSTGNGYDIAIAHAPYLEFRREAVSLANRGEISIVGQNILEQLRQKLGIESTIADAIKKDVLLPYQHQAQKQRQFDDVRAQVSRREMPISDNTQAELLRLRQIFDLQDDSIPTPVAAPINAVASDPSPTLLPPDPVEANEAEPPAPENRVTRFFRERGLMPTPLSDGAPLDEPEPRTASPFSQLLQHRNSSDRLRLAIAGAAVLALLAAVLWAAFQPITQPNSPTEFFSEGLRRAKNGDRKGAIEAYTQAIDRNGNNANFYYNRGIEFARAGDPNRAIDDYNQAIQFDRAFADAYFNRANVYASRGDRAGAIRDYQQAARLYQQQNQPQLQRDALNAVDRLQQQ